MFGAFILQGLKWLSFKKSQVKATAMVLIVLGQGCTSASSKKPVIVFLDARESLKKHHFWNIQ